MRQLLRVAFAVSTFIMTAAAVTLASSLLLPAESSLKSRLAYGVLELPDSASAEMIARGDSIFHGIGVSVKCASCHGPGAKGTRIGPDLTDGVWLRGDGSYASIVNVIRTGVYWPPELLPSMPAYSGAIDPDEIAAVAAYVFDLSRRKRQQSG